ncbi:MAG: hypothetical protein ACPG66_08990 [Flavobacteriales bacterium]
MNKTIQSPMKNIIFLTVLLSFQVLGFSQTNFYEDPRFPALAATHETIAILPFDATVTLRPRQMKDISPEQLERMEIAEGEGIQGAMHSWFLKRKKRGSLKVDVQAPNVTRAKLLKAGVTPEMLPAYEPQEICEILGIDAIIMGTFETNKPMSQGAAIALGVLFGVGGSTEKAVVNLSIYEGENGELMCSYLKNLNGGLGSSSEDLINVLMRKASRRIAYTKSVMD